MKQKNIILVFVLLFLIISTCAFCVYKKPVLEAFNMQRCMTVNNIASETASKAIIAGEIIDSLTNHEKLLQIYTNSQCEPNEYNIDGTVKINPNACKLQCNIPDRTGSGTCAYKGKTCTNGKWKSFDSFPLSDRYVPGGAGANNGSIYYSNDQMCERKGNQYPNKCRQECTKYKETCLITGVKYDNCEPLSGFSIFKDDIGKLDDVGNEYLKFAYNVIPHIASHDIILKKILNSYSYYDIGSSKVGLTIENEGLVNQTVSLSKNPTDRNYNKLATKFHNALSGYTIGNCGSAAADDSVEDNDGYVLWILVDWIRYQDHFIQNHISGNFSTKIFDAAAEVR